MGDVVSQGYNPSTAFFAVDIKNNALAKPTGFERIWWNSGGRGDRVSFWKPTCPSGFYAVGHIANPSFDMPSADEIRCVNQSLITVGKWTNMWDDKGDWAKEDATVYRADASDVNAVGVSAMGAIKRYGPMDTSAYVLKRDKVKLNWGKRVKQVQITNFVYDFKNNISASKIPTEIVGRTIANNCGTTLFSLHFFLCLSYYLN